MKRKLVAFSLFILMIVSVIAPCASAETNAADSAALTLAVNPYGNPEDSIDTIKLYLYSDGNYCLFLPSDCDKGDLTVYFEAEEDVCVDGIKLTSGEATDAFAGKTSCSVSCGDSIYSLTILTSENIPAMYISTKSGSLDYIHADKSNKESGNIRIYEDGEATLDTALKQIKGRGNATWNHPKKPYNIKFDKKTSLFGMPKAKKWTLLAPYNYDNGLMKNAMVFDLAQAIGLDETSSFRFVDLYINGGYLGTYLVCESVEIGSGRLEITDLEKATEDVNPDIELSDCTLSGVRTGYVPGSKKWAEVPNDPENITGGYLLEFDYYYRSLDEATGFTSNIGQPIVIGSPEYASKAQVDYISSYWQDAEDALYSATGYNAKGKYYTEYFDMESLVKCYVIQELSKNVDSGITSFYFYKDADNDKICAGPLWDFDHAMGAPTSLAGGQLTIYEPDTWYANILRRNVIDTACSDYYTFFAQCWSKSDFREAVINEWSSFAPVMSSDKKAEFQSLRDSLTASGAMNSVRWKLCSGTDPQTAMQYYQSLADKSINFLFDRKAALDKGFAEDGATVVYRKNGGAGSDLFDSRIYSIGEQARAKVCTYSCGNLTFAGWNTKADGSGRAIEADSLFTVTDNYTVLYAQWEEYKEPTPPVLTLSSSSQTVGLGKTVSFTASVIDLPDGAYVVWNVSGSSSYTVSADTMTCTVTGKSLGDIKVTATLVNSDGSPVSVGTTTASASAKVYPLGSSMATAIDNITSSVRSIFNNITAGIREIGSKLFGFLK